MLRARFSRVVVTRAYVGALLALKAASFDVVLSDYVLGDGNGADLLNLVAATTPETQRVLYSGSLDEREIEPSRAELVLAKPLNSDALMAAVARHAP